MEYLLASVSGRVTFFIYGNVYEKIIKIYEHITVSPILQEEAKS